MSEDHSGFQVELPLFHCYSSPSATASVDALSAEQTGREHLGRGVENIVVIIQFREAAMVLGAATFWGAVTHVEHPTTRYRRHHQRRRARGQEKMQYRPASLHGSGFGLACTLPGPRSTSRQMKSMAVNYLHEAASKSSGLTPLDFDGTKAPSNRKYSFQSD